MDGLIIIPNLSISGAEKVMWSLYSYMRSRGLLVNLIALTSSRGQSLSCSDPHIITLNHRHVLQALPQLVFLLIRKKPSWILSTIDHANILTFIACCLTGCADKLAIRIATSRAFLVDPIQGVKERIVMLLTRIAYPNVKKIIVQTNAAIEEYRLVYGQTGSNIKAINNPFVRQRVQHQASNEYYQTQILEALEDKYKPVISVGRLSWEKGHYSLIRALKIARKFDNFKLFIVGSGPLEYRLKQFCHHLDISDYVVFCGFVENPLDIDPKSSILVLSSLYEGMPNILIEGKEMNFPIVSTDCCNGPRDILGPEYPFFVEPGSSIGLAKSFLAISKAREEYLLDSEHLLDSNLDSIANIYLEFLNS